MELSTNALNVLKKLEGLVLHPYIDTAGHLTIGYGHLIKFKIKDQNKIVEDPRLEFVTKTKDLVSITEKQAELLLLLDLRSFEKAITSTLGIIEQCHFDALTLFAYNLGVGRLMGSTLMKKFLRGDFVKLEQEFLRWDNATVKGKLVEVTGLTIRRALEASIFQQKLIKPNLSRKHLGILEDLWDTYLNG